MNKKKIDYEQKKEDIIINNIDFEKDEVIDIKNSDEEPIYIMTLELEHKKIVHIKIYYDSDPELLAQTFCKQHQLDFSSMEYLKEKIGELIKQFENKEKEIEEVESDNMSESNNSKKNKTNISYENIIEKDKEIQLREENNLNIFKNKEIKNNINKGNEDINNMNTGKTLENEKSKSRKKEKEILNTNNIINKTNNIFQIRSNTDTNRNLVNSSSIKKNLLNKCLSINTKISGKNFFEKIFNVPKIKRLIPHEEIKPNTIEHKFKTLNQSKNISFSAKKNENTKKYIENEINYLPSSYRKQLSQSKMERLKKEYQDKYPFKPKINNNYKTELNFNQRQQFFTRLYKQRHEELKNFVDNYKKDCKQLFSPKISKKIHNFNHSNIDVYNKNYLYAKKYERKKQDLYKKYYNKNENKFIQLGKESEKILQKKNDEIFTLIFKELDSDQDNYISPNLINTNNTPKEVLKIIEPLLNELIEDKQTLDQSYFIQAMNKLYNNISIEDKYLINDIYRNKRGLNLRIYYCKIKRIIKKNIKPIINKK